MTKKERYLEVKRQADKRERSLPKRRVRAFIVRAIFFVGAIACIILAVAGTRPREAAKIKRWISSVTSVFRDDQIIVYPGVDDTSASSGDLNV